MTRHRLEQLRELGRGTECRRNRAHENQPRKEGGVRDLLRAAVADPPAAAGPQGRLVAEGDELDNAEDGGAEEHEREKDTHGGFSSPRTPRCGCALIAAHVVKNEYRGEGVTNSLPGHSHFGLVSPRPNGRRVPLRAGAALE